MNGLHGFKLIAIIAPKLMNTLNHGHGHIGHYHHTQLKG